MLNAMIQGELIDGEVIRASAAIPRAPVTVRVATMADMPAIDALQKKNSRALGFFPRQQMEGYIKGGWVLVAEGAVASGQWSVAREDQSAGGTSHSPPTTGHSLLGYVASRDRYQKRDEVGVVYQMCVSPEARRQQIAATLMREVFARAAYGCRLFCCWCAQDLKQANAFWASLGFVPLAFRAGSRSKDRVHIFWQKRVREEDQSTPWWFPACTGGGAIREDRVVLPIPPGVKWNDPMPRLLPEGKREVKALNHEETKCANRDTKNVTRNSNLVASSRSSRLRGESEDRKSKIENRQSLSGLSFGSAVETDEQRRARRKARLLEKLKLDPDQIAKARELRDRFLEQALEGRLVLPEAQPKYAITRLLPACRDDDETMPALPLLAA